MNNYSIKYHNKNGVRSEKVNIRGEKSKRVISNKDEIIILCESFRSYFSSNIYYDTPIIAFRNCFGKIYFYNNGEINFLQENKYSKYKILIVDKKLIDKVNQLYVDMTNIMKKPIELNDPTDVMIEYDRRQKIIKQMQKGIRRTIKLYYRSAKEE